MPAKAAVPIAVMFSPPTVDGTETLPPLPVYSPSMPPETLYISDASAVGASVVVCFCVVG